MTASARQPHHSRQGQRLLALLLAVLLSVASLSGHAAMDACASDCSAPPAEMLAGADLDCSTCAVVAAAPVMASLPAATPIDAAGPALVDHAPLPARPPPRP
ncbi:hypothetical protein FEI13_05140 [Halomonas urmiana]|uniref:DUF2946 domain-containing protein n=1 Tax=Halomonas urmiana TaxID=490901 RepID=A0A5R8MK26_9GAMM|nr:hypothetical protein [Halomonas urmiana]TLF52258.1 hypothetical protein FEI13_05140 [Halomonas urmiana]